MKKVGAAAAAVGVAAVAVTFVIISNGRNARADVGGRNVYGFPASIADGAENTEPVLALNGHEDLVKSYTYTKHQHSPGIYLISTVAWEKLTPEQQHLRDSFTKTNDNIKS